MPSTTGVVELSPVILLNDVPVATPKTGVVRVGEVPKTSAPEPVSSEIIPASSAEVVAARAESLSVVTTSVLDVGMVVPLTDVAVATPSAGVVKLGETRGAFNPIAVAVVEAKLASSPRARASSSSVFKVAGAESTSAATAASA